MNLKWRDLLRPMKENSSTKTSGIKNCFNRAFILLPLAKILAFRRRANHFAESDTEKGQETERGM